MQTTVGTSHSSTSDLLTWPELPQPEFAASSHRSRQYSQPSDKIGEVLRGSQLTEEEEQRKPRPGYKMNEMAGNRTGDGIFPASSKGTTSEAIDANSNSRTSIRIYKQAPNGVSQISFSTEGSIPPKKPTSLPEVTKQRELSGTLLTEPDSRSKRQISSAKTKELVGNDIFGPAPEVVPRSMAPARTFEVEESKEIGEPFPPKVKVSNPAAGQSNAFFSEESVNRTSKKLHGQKFAELTGNNIFMEDGPAVSAEKPLSRAKLREMTGSDIFADGKAETREYLKGSRRPPGGGSSIALV